LTIVSSHKWFGNQGYRSGSEVLWQGQLKLSKRLLDAKMRDMHKQLLTYNTVLQYYC